MPAKGPAEPLTRPTGFGGPGMGVLNPAYFPRWEKPASLWNDWDREQEADEAVDLPSYSYGSGWK